MTSVLSVSSLNDTLDGSSGSKLFDPLTLQKKLQKIEKCISSEEKTRQTIQDQLIQLGISRSEKSSSKYQSKAKELEDANDKASRHIEEYKQKKRKYEAALKNLADEQARVEQQKLVDKAKENAVKGRSLPVGLNAVDVVKGGRGMLNTLIRNHKNGESGGSARSRDSKGSREESLNLPSGDASTAPSGAFLKPASGDMLSNSSMESDSQESQKRMRRLEEIAEVVDNKLDPLTGDVQEIKEKLEQFFKLTEDSKTEQAEERKSSVASFDDIIRRCGYVEEQIHDLIELHQKETAETKTYLFDAQDKMNYVFQERIRDMRDEINGLNTRIAKIEHRQKEDESLARTEAAKSVFAEMSFKVVDMLLLLGQLVIAVVGAITQFFQMTAENSTRLVTFLIGIIAILIVVQFRSDLPFSEEIGSLFNALTRPIRKWTDLVAFKVFGVNMTVDEEFAVPDEPS